MLEKSEEKQDRRARRTRKMILEALTQLLAEKAFNKISVQDIVERADVNRSSFYAHFEDKYALLNHYVRDTFQQLLESKQMLSPAFTPHNLRLLTLTACEYVQGFTGRCTLSFQPNDQMVLLFKEMQISQYDVILEWVKHSKASAPSQTSPEILAMITSSAIFGALSQWVRDGRQCSPDQLADQILSTLTSGLGSYFSVDTPAR